MAVLDRCTLFMLMINLICGYSHHINVDTYDSDYVFWPEGIAVSRLSKRALTEGQSQDIGIAASVQGQKVKGKEMQPPIIEEATKNDKNSTTVKTVHNTTVAENKTVNDTVKNITKAVPDKGSPAPVDLSNPGVVKRGLIVFGGFALLGVAYFIFYRGKKVKNENPNLHNASDGPQFRYGVLQSDDKRDNLELSRMPLTMESDEDEDDDLEIFDLNQKKKSLSYINLQSAMEDVENVHNSPDNPQSDNERDNLLLDIDDRIPDNLINLTNSNNKFVL